MKLPAIAIYLLIAAVVTAWGALKPSYDWDVLGYMAAALSWEQTDKKQIHDNVYAFAQMAMPEETYRELTTQGSYRQDMYANHAHFAQQIPFYSIRPLYVACLYLLHKLGINLAQAAAVISALSYFLMAVILLLWITKYIDGVCGVGLPLLLILSPPMLMTARLTTPDALSAAMLVTAIYVLAEKRWLIGFGLLMLLSIFVRTDNIIYALILFSYLVLFGKHRLALSLPGFTLFVAAAVLSYLTINLAAGNYGWSTVFHHTLVQFINDPAEHSFTISLPAYLKALRSGLSLLVGGSMVIFLFFGLLAYYLSARKKILVQNIYPHLTLILGLSVLLRYALFPAILDRFFVAHYMLVAVALVITSAYSFATTNREFVPHLPPPQASSRVSVRALKPAGIS